MQILAKVFLCVSTYGVAIVQGSNLNRKVLAHSAVVASDGFVAPNERTHREVPANSATVASDGTSTLAVNRVGTSATDNIEATWSRRRRGSSGGSRRRRGSSGGSWLQQLKAKAQQNKQQLHSFFAQSLNARTQKLANVKAKYQPDVDKAAKYLKPKFEAAKKKAQQYGAEAAVIILKHAEQAALECKSAVQKEIDRLKATAQAELLPMIEDAKSGTAYTVDDVEKQVEALLAAIAAEDLVAAATAVVAVEAMYKDIKQAVKTAGKKFEAAVPELVNTAGRTLETSIATVSASCMTSVLNAIENAKPELARVALKALEDAEDAAKKFQVEVNTFKQQALATIEAEYKKLLAELESKSNEAIKEYNELKNGLEQAARS